MNTSTPGDLFDVIVVGAGQAGLAMAYHLSQQDVRFLVIDSADAIGESWRTRWDSLRLFTPAQYDGLPGMRFPAPDDFHPTKDMVANYLQAYAAHFALPVRLRCAVSRVEPVGERFLVHTSDGVLSARQVVVATGPLQQPVVPALAADLSAGVVQLHSSDYHRPSDVPLGSVVVVGAGNSGRQIAEELAATHDVTLAVGTEPVQLPQRLLRKDLFWWLTRLGVITKTAESRMARRMRARGDLVIGASLRRLQQAGVRVRPRVVSIMANEVSFEFGQWVQASAVVWATGFRADYSWIDVPGVVGADGGVRHERGITSAPGLAFLGLPWQHTRGSSLLGFVQHDAAWVSGQLEAQRAYGRDAHVSRSTVTPRFAAVGR